MTGLERVIPAPALLELDEVDLAIPPSHAWEMLRHGELGAFPLVHALFSAPRGFPRRIDDFTSSSSHPGFQILSCGEEASGDGRREVVIGAIGKMWHLDIPFVHVRDAEAFRACAEPGLVKVAWALRVSPIGERDTHVELELRADATDAEAWSKFRRYFSLVAHGSRFIRQSLLASLARQYGTPDGQEEHRTWPGDELLPDAGAQITRGITIAAPPDVIWPWLVRRVRGGTLDPGRKGRSSEPHLRVSDVVKATGGEDGFEVRLVVPERALVLGALYDADAKKHRAFGSERSVHFWQTTWSFVLEPIDKTTTRLHVRARAAFPAIDRIHVEWIKPVHTLSQKAQLEHFAAQVEQRLPSDVRDIAEGLGGAAVMVAAFATPFMRAARSHWGVDADVAARTFPGDELIDKPRWSWTHGIEIDASPDEVWPWIAQLGADRGGFYSYQWLENVAGCELRNAERVHADWALNRGDVLVLHPKMPPLPVVAIEPGHFFVVHAPVDAEARKEGKPWASASWLFLVEPAGDGRTRLVSRYRCATSDDLVHRLSFSPALLEPIGFAMDRRMLLGVKARVEARRSKRSSRGTARRGAAQKVEEAK